MIRESKIKELTFNKVMMLLDPELNKYGFKYQKSKNYFIRKENGFNQIVSVYTPYSPISFDESTDQLHLTFYVSSQLELPEYENGFLKSLEKNHIFQLDQKTLFLKLNFQ